MKTTPAKPSDYRHRKPIASGIAFSDSKREYPHSLKNLFKNIKRSPE